MNSCIVLTSGGIDSYVSLHLLRNEYELFPIYFDFNQNTAAIEKKCAEDQICSLNLRPLRIVHVSDYMNLIQDSWANTNDITNVIRDSTNLFLPGRNIVFLLYSGIIAFNESIDCIAISSLKTDISGDGSSKFIASMNRTLHHGLAVKKRKFHTKIIAPVKQWDKTDVIRYIKNHNLDLSLTWSCYTSGPEPCNICPSCLSKNNAIKSVYG